MIVNVIEEEMTLNNVVMIVEHVVAAGISKTFLFVKESKDRQVDSIKLRDGLEEANQEEEELIPYVYISNPLVATPDFVQLWRPVELGSVIFVYWKTKFDEKCLLCTDGTMQGTLQKRE